MADTGDVLELYTANAEATMGIGRALGACCVVGDVVALDGELGAGKTQFVRGLAEGLGFDPRQVSSPTFVIVQEYDRRNPSDRDRAGDAAEVLVHIDAYRLRSAEDLASIGWEGDGGSMREGAIVAIEWASLMGSGLPADHLSVRIEHEHGDGRRLSLIAHGRWVPRMAQVRSALAEAGRDASS